MPTTYTQKPENSYFVGWFDSLSPAERFAIAKRYENTPALFLKLQREVEEKVAALAAAHPHEALDGVFQKERAAIFELLEGSDISD